MKTEILLQYLSFALMAIGALAFIVSAITQVIKDMPHIKNVQTNVVALVASIILCPVALVAYTQWKNTPITWYMIFASFIAAFIVYLVSTGGWEKVKEMWNRTKYHKEDK